MYERERRKAAVAAAAREGERECVCRVEAGGKMVYRVIYLRRE